MLSTRSAGGGPPIITFIFPFVHYNLCPLSTFSHRHFINIITIITTIITPL